MANTFTSLHLHVVFSTKGRTPWISERELPRLFDYIAGAVRGVDAVPTAVGGMADHVHVLISHGTEFLLRDFVKELKRSSNAWLKQQGLVPSEFHWQRGCGAFSVSRWDVEKVAEYVRNQAEHHRRSSFAVEYRKLLERHGVPFDERYMLD